MARPPPQTPKKTPPLPPPATQQERRSVRVMCKIKCLESPLYLFHDYTRLEAEVFQSKPNLLLDSFREEKVIRVLKHNPDFSGQLGNALLRGVVSVDRNLSQSWFQ